MARLSTGDAIIFFDQGFVERSHIHRNCTFILSGTVLGEIERVEDGRFEVESWIDDPDIYVIRESDGSVKSVIPVPQTANKAFAGEVVAKRPHETMLDIGCGTITFDHDIAFAPTPGWFVRVSEVYLELIEFECGWAPLGRLWK